MQNSSSSTQKFLILAIVSELALLALGVLLIWLFALQIPNEYSFEMILRGIWATGPIFAFNLGVFFVLANPQRGKKYREFLEDIIIPLCRNFNFISALIVSLAAGFCEEIFFRGVLNTLLAGWFGNLIGFGIGSFIFAYVHFLGRAVYYWQLVLFYFLFGFYFSVLVWKYQSLYPAIVAHAFYNYLIILLVRYTPTKFLLESSSND